MQPIISKVGENGIKVSIPQPTMDTFYTMEELIQHRDQAQAQLDKFNDLLTQAKALGIADVAQQTVSENLSTIDVP